MKKLRLKLDLKKEKITILNSSNLKHLAGGTLRNMETIAIPSFEPCPSSLRCLMSKQVICMASYDNTIC